jgi:potassium-transporting ATPase KdpC subunit
MSKTKNRLDILKKHRLALQPALAIALVSLVACGLIYPLFVTGVGQALFPYQANGQIITVNGTAVGSNLIAQNFTQPIFFHPRNDSASGVDPDITLQDAYSQANRIQNDTGISNEALVSLINKDTEGTYWIFGSPFVNVLRLNLDLIKAYPTVYQDFQ